jgi:hypothetical protein
MLTHPRKRIVHLHYTPETHLVNTGFLCGFICFDAFRLFDFTNDRLYCIPYNRNLGLPGFPYQVWISSNNP